MAWRVVTEVVGAGVANAKVDRRQSREDRSQRVHMQQESRHRQFVRNSLQCWHEHKTEGMRQALMRSGL